MKKFIRRSSSLAAVNFEQALQSETHAPLDLSHDTFVGCASRGRLFGGMVRV